MPFFDTHDRSVKSTIDFDHQKPIDVIVAHNMDGKFIPRYIQVNSSDETRHQFKIEAIKQIKELNNRHVFYCLITNYNRQQPITLTFYIQEHTWYIEV